MNRILFSASLITILAMNLGCPMVPTDGDSNGSAPNGGNTTNGATTFSATVNGDQEAPAPVTTDGSGSGTFTLNADQTELTFTINATGLSGPLAAAHFHNAPAGENGTIVFDLANLTNDTNGQITIAGTTQLIDWLGIDAAAELIAGNIYLNIHSASFPAGEIRGQLTVDP